MYELGQKISVSIYFILLSYYVFSHETSKRKNYGNMLTTVLYSSTPKW